MLKILLLLFYPVILSSPQLVGNRPLLSSTFKSDSPDIKKENLILKQRVQEGRVEIYSLIGKLTEIKQRPLRKKIFNILNKKSKLPDIIVGKIDSQQIIVNPVIDTSLIDVESPVIVVKERENLFKRIGNLFKHKK